MHLSIYSMLLVFFMGLSTMVYSVDSLRCYCTYQVRDCINGTMICNKDVKHCFLHFGANVKHDFFSCYPFNNAKMDCPNVVGQCVSRKPFSNDSTTACCCFGKLCNSVENFTQMIKVYRGESVTRRPLTSTLPVGLTYQDTWLYSLIPLSLLVVACLILYCLYRRVLMHNVTKKRIAFLRSSNRTIRETVDGSSLCAVLPHCSAYPTIDQVATKCVKVELKAQGRFGCVWLVRLTHDDGVVYEAAAKIFPSHEEKSWETELTIYRLPGMNHSNILRFIGSDKVGDGINREAWLVTEYQSKGSVCDYLKTGQLLSLSELLEVLQGMVRGLAYLHQEDPIKGKPSVAHRDFKSSNVLLGFNLRPVIADLGLAVKFDSGRNLGDAHLQVGTRRYMAPEVLEGAIQFSREAFLRIDVYALGLVMWELMTRCVWAPEVHLTSAYKVPFEEDLGHQPGLEEMQRWVVQGRQRPRPHPLWTQHNVMSCLWETVEECWDQDSEARLSAVCVAERLHSLINVHLPVDPTDTSDSGPLIVTTDI